MTKAATTAGEPPREPKPLWCDVDELALLAHGLGRRTEGYYWRQTTSTVQLELKLERWS